MRAFSLKVHPIGDRSNKKYWVYYLSHGKEGRRNSRDAAIEKNWKNQWFWVTRQWLTYAGVDSLPLGECVSNEFQAKVAWILGKLTKRQIENINLALMVTEESKNWARLTTPLALFKAEILSIKLVDSIDYPLCFNINNTPV